MSLCSCLFLNHATSFLNHIKRGDDTGIREERIIKSIMVNIAPTSYAPSMCLAHAIYSS